MLRKTQLFAVTAGLVLLAGCGQSQPPSSASLTHQDAVKVESLAKQSNLYLAYIFKAQAGAGSLRPEQLLGASQLESRSLSATSLRPNAAFPDCATQEGNFSDQDGDTFPANNVATILNDCTFSASTPLGTASLNVTGQYARKDQNDSVPFPGSGFRFGIGGPDGNGGADFSVKLGNTVIASGSTALNYDINRQSSGAYQTTFGFLLARSDIDVDSFLSKDTAYTYTPDDNSNPFASGTLTGSSNVGYTPVTGGRTVNLDFTFNNLHYKSSCLVGFDRGNINYTDSFGNDVTLTYNCDSVTATYNGSSM